MKGKDLDIDKYFEIARSAPIVITKDEVMKIIGNMVSAPPISFGQTIVKFKNVIIMTTTTIATIVTAFVYFGSNSANNLEPISPQTSNNEIFIIEDEEEDSFKIEDLTITQDSNKVVAGSVINYNEIIINEESEDDIFEDNLVAEGHDESVNFIIPKHTASDNSTDSSFLTEIYTKSVCHDTIKLGKNTKSKQFNSEYDYKDGATINVSNRYGEIMIKTWDKNKVKVEAEVTVKSSDEKNIEEFFNNFDITPRQDGKDLIIEQPVVSQNRFGIIFIQFSKTKFKNGKKIKGIKRFSVDYTVTVPKSSNLLVMNKYNDVYIDDFDGKLSVELYEAELKAGNIQGAFDLSLKYSDARVMSINNSTIKVYESNLEILAANKVNLESKYSEVKFNKINALNADSYEDELAIFSNMSKLKGKLRYGKLGFMNISECDLDIYETNITGGIINRFNYEGKYATIEIQGADSMDIFSSYEDKFKIAKAGSIYGLGKYAEFDIRMLTKSMKFNNYEGHVNVFSVGNSPMDLKFKSKYTSYNLVLNSQLSYQLEANCKYGNFDFPKEKFEKTTYIPDEDELKLQGVFNKTSDGPASSLSFDCYEGDVNISLR